MNRQLKNMVESLAPAPPTVNEFMVFVCKLLHNEPEGPQPDALFGDIGVVAAGKPKGSAKNELIGAKLAKQFHDACQARVPPVVFTDLDDWLVSLSKFVVEVDCLYDTEEQRTACLNRRRELVGNGKVRSMSVQTYRTYVNALMRMVRELPGPYLVPSCTSTFPRFNEVMRTAIKKCGAPPPV